MGQAAAAVIEKESTHSRSGDRTEDYKFLVEIFRDDEGSKNWRTFYAAFNAATPEVQKQFNDIFDIEEDDPWDHFTSPWSWLCDVEHDMELLAEIRGKIEKLVADNTPEDNSSR